MYPHWPASHTALTAAIAQPDRSNSSSDDSRNSCLRSYGASATEAEGMNESGVQLFSICSLCDVASTGHCIASEILANTAFSSNMLTCCGACCCPAVPPSKRRRRTVSSTVQRSTLQPDSADTPRKPPPRRQRKTSAAAAAAGVAEIASTRAAEAEKAAAGENRAVEHVALQADEWTDQLMFGAGQQQQQQDEDVVVVDTPAPRRPRRTGQRRQSLPLAL